MEERVKELEKRIEALEGFIKDQMVFNHNQTEINEKVIEGSRTTLSILQKLTGV